MSSVLCMIIMILGKLFIHAFLVQIKIGPIRNNPKDFSWPKSNLPH